MTRIVSPRFGISYPDPALRNEPADVPADLKKLVDAIETAAINLQGLLSARPAASIVGRFFRATDTKQTFYDTGTAWELVDGTPAGVMMPWPYAEANVPTGWALCYGQSVTKAANPNLWAIANASGFPHGGDASNVTLPDMRGRVPAGKDNMGGTAASRVGPTNNGTTLGGVNGQQDHQLTSAQMPSHSHTVNSHSHGGAVVSAGAHSHLSRTGHGFVQNFGSGDVASFLWGTAGAVAYSDNSTDTHAGHQHTINAEAPGTTPNGSDNFHNNLQPGIMTNYIIKLG